VPLLARTLLIVALILGGGVAQNLSFSHSSTEGLRPRIRTAPAAHRVSIQEVWTGNSIGVSDSNRLGTASHSASFGEIGRGKGIVFSPDLSEPGNREFYRALGFAYFEDPDWHVVLKQIRAFNEAHPADFIETLLIQSHGTNGDALKLQNGKEPDAPRSYIAPAALQENLAGTGVRVCLLAACNAGRLFRPENYLTVHADEGNHLFEPATLGIINASADFDPTRSAVTIVRRVESHIEVINECRVSELSPEARSEIIKGSDGRLKPTTRIAIPEMLIQVLLKDEELRLVAWGHEMEKSRAETNDSYRERLISRFLRFVNTVAAKEQQASTNSPQAD
jgi:hypothetical protein